MSLFSAFSRKHESDELPLLTLRELVLFPHTLIPVFVSQASSITAVERASHRDNRVFCACRRANAKDNDSYNEGSVARIVQQLKLPDGTIRVLLEGEYRARIQERNEVDGAVMVRLSPIGAAEDHIQDSESMAIIRAIHSAFTSYADLSRKIGNDVQAAVNSCENAERLCNLVSNALVLKPDRKIELLSIEDLDQRLAAVLETIERENEIIGIQKRITGKVKTRMDKTQREYILNEQLKEINRELGKTTEQDEFKEQERVLESKNLPSEVLAKSKKELDKLRKLQGLSPEAGVLRAWLEWIGDLPWCEATQDNSDLLLAERILDEDHFNLKKAKERIIEFMAVKQLSQSLKGPILCFVGPPGTGKTSLGRSVARALGRSFVRISLGGVRDEAEIRGHRKTYVGALPGKILQSMRRAATVNPVFLLDEIDKLSSDFRGDPASALLEVLDPEQNNTFTDHYLEVPYDLSKVLFIATANSLHTIPYPLLDRMEIIEVPGYGETDKLQIAKKFLIPSQLEENGLSKAKVSFSDEAILSIIRSWTMESGVRSLKRSIARCVRRLAKDAVKKGYIAVVENPEAAVAPSETAQTERTQQPKDVSTYRKAIGIKDLEKLLGRKTHKDDLIFKDERCGVAYGLAWTETGGTLLPVETAVFPGSGELILTGNLGDVMKESARTALSWLRANADRYKLSDKSVSESDFHIHVPEGAIPKDGPSAGITLAVSLLSALSGRAPVGRMAMTGELTLTGRVLAIGGLKEKLLAAMRNRMEAVIIPSDNQDELKEVGKEVQQALRIHLAENIQDAMDLLFP